MSILQNALREAARRELENIPAANKLDLAFSDSFQKRMVALISGQKMQRCFLIGHRGAPTALLPFLDESNAGKLLKRARSRGVIIENLAES